MFRVATTIMIFALLLLVAGLIRAGSPTPPPPEAISLVGHTTEPPAFDDLQVVAPEVVDLTGVDDVPPTRRTPVGGVESDDDVDSLRNRGTGTVDDSVDSPDSPDSPDSVDSPDDSPDDSHDSSD